MPLLKELPEQGTPIHRRFLRRIRMAERMGPLDPFIILEALDAADDDARGVVDPEGQPYERVSLEDRTLLGGIPSEYVLEVAGGALDDRDTLMLVAEHAPTYAGWGVEDAEDLAEYASSEEPQD